MRQVGDERTSESSERKAARKGDNMEHGFFLQVAVYVVLEKRVDVEAVLDKRVVVMDCS